MSKLPVKLPNEPAITPQIVAEHGLSPEEYQRVLAIMGRAPTLVELDGPRPKREVLVQTVGVTEADDDLAA